MNGRRSFKKLHEETNRAASNLFHWSKGHRHLNQGTFAMHTRRYHSSAATPHSAGPAKYLGGERGNNDKIYTIPGHAHRVLVIDPTVEPPTIKPIGPSFVGRYKWLRGVRMSTGIIYGIPCHADAILRIDPVTDTVTTIDWDDKDPGAPAKGMPWKWHGGNIAKHDGCLYCIPTIRRIRSQNRSLTQRRPPS
jgi:hypothetical protein